MKETITALLEQIKSLWSKWTLVQKLILAGITAALIFSIVLLIGFSSRPNMVPLISSAIKDENLVSKISMRLDQEGIKHTVGTDGRIFVESREASRRMVSLLFREGLIPSEASPWDVFQMDKWTVTDFERNVNLRRAITQNLEQHLNSLEDIDSARITLVLPEKSLFIEDNEPVSASVIITPKPGSDITENRKKIEGIVKLIRFAVEGLKEENITITDYRGIVLNDFQNMRDVDRLDLTKKQIKTVRELENQYKKSIITSLKQIYGDTRVQVVNMDITMDLGEKKVQTQEHYPITMKQDNPRTPYDETEVIKSITLSQSMHDEKFEGTGFNPEGPPGQEGQTPPSYKDLEGMVGKYQKSVVTQNEVVNTRNIQEEKGLWEITRVTAAVAIDGVWKWKYNDRGEVLLNPDGSIQREYISLSDEELGKAKNLVEHAIGFNRDRGDSVTVQHIQFNREKEHSIEDEKYRRQKRIRNGMLYALIGLAVLFVAFLAFRLISREIERRRRLREEELARQHQAMREAALRSAEEEGVEVQMSVEERARLEMQENAINMAREHPEDVAQLIRTWLMEE